MKNISTRGRLILLVLLAALPALALIVYGTLAQRAAAEAHAREEINDVAMLAAKQQGQIIEGARQVLVAFSHLPSAIHGDRARCNEYLAQVMKNTSGLYHSMGLYHPNGELYCNAVPWQGKVVGRDRLYFQLAMSTGKFSIGEYQVGRVTKLQGINFGYPITDAQGTVTGVAFIAIDLGKLNQFVAATSLPEGGILNVVDRNGIILAQSGVSGRVGQKLGNARILEIALAGKEGVFDIVGRSGVERLLAYASAAGNPDGSIPIRVMVSIPQSVVFADANRALIRNLVGTLVATILLLAGAWYGAELFVLRNIRTLLDTARRVHSGDLTARTGMHSDKEELSQVGVAFDEMAAALEEREAGLKQAMQDLHLQAITDTLTGLFNRRYLYDLLPRELARAKRNGAPVAVIMLDIDHFKRVNDSLGHEAGDLALKEFGALLKSNVRDVDIASRYGGEEFCLVLPDAPLNIARRKAEDIRAALERIELKYQGKPLGKITASFGVAMFPGHGADPDSLLRAADGALYAAKAGGRNRVVVYAPGDAAARATAS